MRGGVIEHVDPCLCPEGRRLAGICRDCLQPVDGMPKRALRCARHRKEAKRRQWREHYARSREKRNAKDSERWHRDPDYRVRKRLARRRRRRENPEKYRKQKARHNRNYALRHPDRAIAQMEAQNRRPERIRARRQWAHENQTVYAGTDQVPTCEECGAEVPWSGRGRPMKKCESCDPKRWEQARKRAAKRNGGRP